MGVVAEHEEVPKVFFLDRVLLRLAEQIIGFVTEVLPGSQDRDEQRGGADRRDVLHGQGPPAFRGAEPPTPFVFLVEV